MSLALIEESAKEVRRLAIAGSPLAVGDFRLKKLIAPLEQAGAKVPVFAQVAKAIKDVVNGTDAESATRLLNLSTLLNAILYTQGKSHADGDFQKLETFPANCASTRTTARVLKPLIEALSSSGGGRFELIKSAVERGAFNDLRLIDPAIRALGDNYPGLADLVAEKILPGYGPGIIPRLKATFDLKGKRQDARKLEVMHKLDPLGTLDLCRKALEDGSVELRVAAIGCLGKHEDQLPLLLEQSNSKNKEVRAAALEALAVHERPEITKLFTDLVKGKALDILVAPFRALRNRQVLNSLLDEGRQALALILKNESEQILRFAEILKCLDSRKDTEVETFLLDAFAKSGALVKLKADQNSAITGLELTSRIAVLLHGIGTPKAMDAILDKRELLPAAVFPLVLDSAFPTLPADKFFSEFSPLLKEKQGSGPGWIKRDFLEQFFLDAYQENRRSPDKSEVNDQRLTSDKPAWDPRWLDTAIKADSHRMVCILARHDHKPSLQYLLKPVDEKQQPNYSASFTVEALARCRHPKVTEFFMEQVTAKAVGTFLHYELQTLLEAAKYLPRSDLPKLDAFAAKFNQRFLDAFLIAIDPLRQPNTN